jgi:hypothetical protein
MHGLAQVLSPAGATRENERLRVQVPAGMGDRSRGPAPERRAPQTLTSARGEGASAAQQPHELGAADGSCVTKRGSSTAGSAER